MIISFPETCRSRLLQVKSYVRFDRIYSVSDILNQNIFPPKLVFQTFKISPIFTNFFVINSSITLIRIHICDIVIQKRENLSEARQRSNVCRSNKFTQKVKYNKNEIKIIKHNRETK